MMMANKMMKDLKLNKDWPYRKLEWYIEHTFGMLGEMVKLQSQVLFKVSLASWEEKYNFLYDGISQIHTNFFKMLKEGSESEKE